jgi:hypothetical protein
VRYLVVALLAGCSGSGGHESDAPPAGRFCKASAGNCAATPLALDGTWTIAAVHTTTGPPGPALGDISFQLAFTPTADEGCYDAVATDVPAGVGPNWPDPQRHVAHGRVLGGLEQGDHGRQQPARRELVVLHDRGERTPAGQRQQQRSHDHAAAGIASAGARHGHRDEAVNGPGGVARSTHDARVVPANTRI